MAIRRTMAKAMNSNNIKMRTGKTLDGFLLPFEDHRATGKMYAQVTVPSAGVNTMDA
jgi:phospholipase D1/2